MTAYTPNLPALITALSSDPGSQPGAGHTRAPQTEFTRARQVAFLENLSVTGSVRSAASAAGVSHQTAYRARRSSPDFRLAWDAALVVARVSVADTVGCRAIDGVEEKVFYHGEEVATRTRYDSRLLLAHLARLDRMAETPLANAFADSFDEALAGFGRGEGFLGPSSVCAEPVSLRESFASEAPSFSSDHGAGRSAGLRQAQPERGGNFPERGEGYGEWGSNEAEVGEGDHTDAPHKNSPGPCNTRSMSYTPHPDWDEVREEMEDDRPVNAPPLAALGDPVTVLACQRDAYEVGEDEWWLVGEAWRRYERAPDGGWAPEPEIEPEAFGVVLEGQAQAVEPVAAPVAANARAPRKAAKALKAAGGRAARKGKVPRKPARDLAPVPEARRSGPSIRSL